MDEPNKMVVDITPKMVIIDSLMDGVAAGTVTTEVAQVCLNYIDGLEAAVEMAANTPA